MVIRSRDVHHLTLVMPVRSASPASSFQLSDWDFEVPDVVIVVRNSRCFDP